MPRSDSHPERSAPKQLESVEAALDAARASLCERSPDGKHSWGHRVYDRVFRGYLVACVHCGLKRPTA